MQTFTESRCVYIYCVDVYIIIILQCMFVQDFPRCRGTGTMSSKSKQHVVLKKASSERANPYSSATGFEQDLRSFLRAIGTPAETVSEFFDIPVDFSGAKVHIIASTPGFHRGHGAMDKVQYNTIK